CDAEGRDPAEIDRTILAMANPLDDPDRFLADMADYAALGVTTVEVVPAGDPIAYTTGVMERIAPALAELGA
ncbi:MAG: LLM class F420-dependent oxidoreductase, partial [Actinobacteria bacterium]|nr:LLM class F420-dependent oxidoreductase [Actinomycetota bacterium]